MPEGFPQDNICHRYACTNIATVELVRRDIGFGTSYAGWAGRFCEECCDKYGAEWATNARKNYERHKESLR